ncbi:hypothetical protein CKA32_000542 [Geitlerinema sp. FC II]|nr:hypothetical protein CKA32_000542 [Geitlerinema sp. FC II]
MHDIHSVLPASDFYNIAIATFDKLIFLTRFGDRSRYRRDF